MNRLFGKRLTALLLSLVMVISLIPAASAASADLSYEVEYDEEVVLKRSDFYNLFDDEIGGDLYYMEITDVDADMDDYGYFVAEDYNEEDYEFEAASDLEGEYFYYSASDVGRNDYDLGTLKFVAFDDAESGTFEVEFILWDEDEDDDYSYEGILEIEVIGEDDKKDDLDEDDYDLVYEVDVDDEVKLTAKDFYNLLDDERDDTLYTLEFTAVDSDMTDYGYFVAKDYYRDEYDLETVSEVKAPDFYYTRTDLDDYGDVDVDFLLDGLTFVSFDDADDGYFTLSFTLEGDEGEIYKGSLAIVVGDVDTDTKKDDDDDKKDDGKVTADLSYEVDPDKSVELKAKDFKNLFEKKYDDFSYLEFTKITNMDGNGYVTALDYDDDEEKLDEDEVEDATFFYDIDDMNDKSGEYQLDDLWFEAYDDADGEVVMMEFTMYGLDEDDEKDGILIIQIGDVETSTGGTSTSTVQNNLRYTITGGTALQINANDIERAFKSANPYGTLQYVKLLNVPDKGALYYDYYNTSARIQMNAANCSNMFFYRDAYGSNAALSKLTYIPSGNNYATAIVYIAYGTGGQQQVGTLNIGVTKSTINEVYGVIPKGTPITFPASAIYNSVKNATGLAMASIKLLELPSTNKGFVTSNSGYIGIAANTSTNYTYASGANAIGSLKFTPTAGFVGSVEIPYMAYDASGNAIAMGKFSLGVVNSVKKFSDVTSSTWCYKYVTELSDANIIGGYSDGTYKFNNTITYGAAMKLIMLAAGYAEQAPTGSHTFSGYLTRAQADGLVSGNVNLSGPITRLQVAQLAAKAMKLNINNLSSTRPFTDTADVYVQAVNAAGIVEGYFANGSSTYKPGNNLTRGQVSAIVWRMRNYNG